VNGLAKARASSTAACLFDHTRVTGVSSQPNGASGSFRVETTSRLAHRERSPARQRAYTTDATPSLRKKVIPIGSYIIATEVLPDA